MRDEEKLKESRKKNALGMMGKIKRYRKRLILEGLAEAKRQGLYIELSEGLKIYKPNAINLPAEGDYVDVRKLIELAMPRLPSLYRKYHAALEKYNQEIRGL